MNKQIYSLVLLVSGLYLGMTSLSAQCEPDTVNCKDTLNPGEFCPAILPDGFVGQVYSEVITILPPAQYPVENVGLVDVVKIVVQDVQNLPPGITYEANADEFFPDTAYCVLLSGTPDSAGVFPLGITVSATVNVPPLGVIQIDSITDDTSVSITVHAEAGLYDPAWEDQFVVCGPNPFQHTTTISLRSRGVEDAELVVYNLLGGVVYREQLRTSPGINRFLFDGQDLRHGTYIYHVSTEGKIYTNRLLKLRD